MSARHGPLSWGEFFKPQNSKFNKQDLNALRDLIDHVDHIMPALKQSTYNTSPWVVMRGDGETGRDKSVTGWESLRKHYAEAESRFGDDLPRVLETPHTEYDPNSVWESWLRALREFRRERTTLLQRLTFEQRRSGDPVPFMSDVVHAAAQREHDSNEY